MARFQSASFANKGRNIGIIDDPLKNWKVSIRFLCEQRKKRDPQNLQRGQRISFNPLPLRTKEETAAQKPRKDV